MRAIKSRDSGIEILVRKTLYRAGYRYRLHRKDLPGKPDIVFSGRRKVIFIHGCFWHAHPDPNCRISHRPASNTGYWNPKLEKTVARDTRNIEQLENAGWRVLALWECQFADEKSLLQTLFEFLGSVKTLTP
jgi:DNA mismatch endonuclease (patch repair protein)